MKLFLLTATIMLSLLPTQAFASRTVYIPPVFSNKDFMCPAGTNVDQLVSCWDFSLTNLSSVSQTVTVTLQTGSFIDGSLSGGHRNNPSKLTTPVNFPAGAAGTSLQAAFCAVCTTNGCNWGVSSVPLGGSGGVGSPPAGTPGSSTYYHAEAVLQLDVAEDRGAIVGRVSQRVYAPPSQSTVGCRDTFTSPPVVFELNGGRAF